MNGILKIMNNKIELVNIEISECCYLDIVSGSIDFHYKKNIPNFTGWYFKDKNTFFALYPKKKLWFMWYNGKEYYLHKKLKIKLKVNGENRTFYIKDYNIKIKYIIKTPDLAFAEWDIWSNGEEDVDLFYKINKYYRKDNFYNSLKNI
ncbi:hypothetical protein FACS1894132_14350 [Clostridia bacterium]|nr:hypothetical protein FACS1894132_14350 [Clostridia bacterium]